MRLAKITATVTLSAMALSSQGVLAHEAGDLYLRASVEKADINADEFSREKSYYLAGGFQLHDKLGIEAGIGEAIEHDFALSSGEQGHVDRMPVTLLANYYPLGGIADAPVQPFLGVGVNYTRFSSEHTDGNADLDVDSNYGVVGQVGMDLRIIDHLYATSYARYTDVNAKFKNSGHTVDKVRLDPLTVGAGVTYRF